MAFWKSEEIKKRAGELALINPFNEANVKHCAYELSLGPEAYTTDSPNGKKQLLAPGEQLVIRPGQFGLLLTEETITVPNDTIALISIKAGIKFRGLVNVSGFHVDPGFHGRLKFSVYNAGSRSVVLARGKPTFLIWFDGLGGKVSDPYNGSHNNQKELTPDDIMQIQGEVSSPAALREATDLLRHELEALRQSFERTRAVMLTIGAAVIAGLILYMIERATAPVPPESAERVPIGSQQKDSGKKNVGEQSPRKEKSRKAQP